MASRSSKSTTAKKATTKAKTTTTRKTTTKAATSRAKTAAPKTTTAKTTTAKTTTAKTTTKAAVSGAASAAPAPTPTVVAEARPELAGPTMKKPDLIDRIVSETGMKKKDVKPVVEAMLTVLSRGLAEGEEMSLPPLGKISVNRVKDLAKAKVVIAKVRQPHAWTTPKPPLAEAAE